MWSYLCLRNINLIAIIGMKLKRKADVRDVKVQSRHSNCWNVGRRGSDVEVKDKG